MFTKRMKQGLAAMALAPLALAANATITSSEAQPVELAQCSDSRGSGMFGCLPLPPTYNPTVCRYVQCGPAYSGSGGWGRANHFY